MSVAEQFALATPHRCGRKSPPVPIWVASPGSVLEAAETGYDLRRAACRLVQPSLNDTYPIRSTRTHHIG
jgi:hypothetical protein